MGKARQRKASGMVADAHIDDVGSASSGSSENCSDAEVSGHGHAQSPVFDDHDDPKSQVVSRAEAAGRKGGKRKKAPPPEPDASPSRGVQEPPEGRDKDKIKVE